MGLPIAKLSPNWGGGQAHAFGGGGASFQQSLSQCQKTGIEASAQWKSFIGGGKAGEGSPAKGDCSPLAGGGDKAGMDRIWAGKTYCPPTDCPPAAGKGDQMGGAGGADGAANQCGCGQGAKSDSKSGKERLLQALLEKLEKLLGDKGAPAPAKPEPAA